MDTETEESESDASIVEEAARPVRRDLPTTTAHKKVIRKSSSSEEEEEWRPAPKEPPISRSGGAACGSAQPTVQSGPNADAAAGEGNDDSDGGGERWWGNELDGLSEDDISGSGKLLFVMRVLAEAEAVGDKVTRTHRAGWRGGCEACSAEIDAGAGPRVLAEPHSAGPAGGVLRARRAQGRQGCVPLPGAWLAARRACAFLATCEGFRWSVRPHAVSIPRDCRLDSSPACTTTASTGRTKRGAGRPTSTGSTARARQSASSFRRAPAASASTSCPRTASSSWTRRGTRHTTPRRWGATPAALCPAFSAQCCLRGGCCCPLHRDPPRTHCALLPCERADFPRVSLRTGEGDVRVPAPRARDSGAEDLRPTGFVPGRRDWGPRWEAIPEPHRLSG